MFLTGLDDNYSLEAMLLKLLLCQSEDRLIREKKIGNLIVRIGFFSILMCGEPSNESSKGRKRLL